VQRRPGKEAVIIGLRLGPRLRCLWRVALADGILYSVKWINFTATVQAIDEEEAIELSGKLDFDQFTTTAKNEEVSSLEDIFEHAGFPQANRTDDSGDDEDQE
jgi:hypothetical protein